MNVKERLACWSVDTTQCTSDLAPLQDIRHGNTVCYYAGRFHAEFSVALFTFYPGQKYGKQNEYDDTHRHRYIMQPLPSRCLSLK